MGSGIKTDVRGRGGFTLVELLVVLALLGVVLAGVYQFFFFTQQSWNRASAEARVMQNARQVLMQLDREVRQARKPNDGTQAVVATADTLEVYTDVTGDGRPERVSYRRSGQGNRPLQRVVTASGQAGYPYTYGAPSGWVNVLDSVANSDIFTVSGTAPRLVVGVRLQVNDVVWTLPQPVEVRSELTVRSRGESSD